MPEIILKNITKKWGDSIAVDNLNMVIKDRGFVTLLGPSGCGKTTTLRMIAGLETPTSGEIIIDGVTVFDSKKGINISPAKRNVGFLFQNYALWPHMTVYKNIAFGLENLKWSKDQIKARVDELVKMLKIEDYLDRYPSQLSGGQQQRVAIARTLAPNPKVLFMDENYEKVKSVNAYLLEQIKSNKKIKINSFSNPYIVNLSIDNITGRTAVDYLNSKGICVSQKSACSIKNTPSKIIMAIYKDKKRAISSFRLSLSELVTYEEIDYLVETLKELAK